jgi:peptide/nickel transport system ATP-binding protein
VLVGGEPERAPPTPPRESLVREPLLEVTDLTVEYITDYGSVKACDHVSFSIGRGEVLGLAGESGSGKSTAAMAALRLLQPPAVITSGRVLFEGQDLLSLSELELRKVRWRRISLVFQSAMNALNPVLTIGEQIADVIRSHEGLGEKPARERAAALLELVGIETAHLDSYPHQLSGGMRQRVVIAIALALDPPMLFMDEPTTALDVVVQKEILQQIAELKQRLGFSILFITHDLSLMLEFCDRIGILYAGRLCELAPARTLLSHPLHPYTRGLMSSFPDASGPRHRLVGIPGSPPDMRRPPSGCRFHPRCAQAASDCAAELPELAALAPGHQVACFRARSYLAPAARPEAEAHVRATDDRATNPELVASARGSTESVRPQSGQHDDATARPPAVFAREGETVAAPAVAPLEPTLEPSPARSLEETAPAPPALEEEPR